MNGPNRSFLGRIQPRAMAAILCAALVALHLILLGTALLRWRSARLIEAQIENINENIESIDETELTELRQLEATFEQARAEVSELQDQVPDPAAPFPLYRRAHSIAQREGTTLISIQRAGAELRPTAAGEVQTHSYGLALEAGLPTCLEYITELEEAGGVELAVENLRIEPGTLTCSFEAVTVALTENP